MFLSKPSIHSNNFPRAAINESEYKNFGSRKRREKPSCRHICAQAELHWHCIRLLVKLAQQRVVPTVVCCKPLHASGSEGVQLRPGFFFFFFFSFVSFLLALPFLSQLPWDQCSRRLEGSALPPVLCLSVVSKAWLLVDSVDAHCHTNGVYALPHP